MFKYLFSLRCAAKLSFFSECLLITFDKIYLKIVFCIPLHNASFHLSVK